MAKTHTRAKRKRGQSTHLPHSHKRRELNGHKTWRTSHAARRWAQAHGIDEPTIVKKGKKYRILERDRTPYKHTRVA